MIYLRNVWRPGDRIRTICRDGQVLVWDAVAGHYTSCHHLTDGQVRYALARCA